MDVFIKLCMLLCGVGLFLVGMHLMEIGLKKSTTKSIRSLFGKINNNSLASYGLGVGTTAIIQSSSATTVMCMGMTGAGIMSLSQSFAFILGARLGTTFTCILVSLSSFRISPLLMTSAFIGICAVLFVNNESIKSLGLIFAGFGVLFAGMDMMSNAITEQEQINAFFVNLFKVLDFPVLLILLGIVFTAIIQSSSATNGLLITLISSGTLNVPQSLFISIGSTIGTCITGLLASVGSSENARKVGIFNILSACIGVLTFGTVVMIFKNPVVKVLSLIPSPQWQLTVFNIIYGLLVSLSMLPFIKRFEKLLSKLSIKERKETDMRCFYIDEKSLNTPAVALIQAKREVENLSELAMENLRYGFESFITRNTDHKKRIDREEERIDFLTRRISDFLIKLANKDLPYRDEISVGTLHHVLDDIERIGDHGVEFSEMGEKMFEEEVIFSDEAIVNLKEMYDTVKREYDVAFKIFKDNNGRLLPEVDKLERSLDSMKKTLSVKHIQRLAEGKCQQNSATLFYSALVNLERIGDHIENLAYSIRSVTGDTNPVVALRSSPPDTVKI